MAEWLGGQTVSSFSFDKTEYEERSSDSVAPRDTPGSPDASTVIIKHLPRGCHRREIFQALKDLGFDKHTLSSSRLNFCSGACLCNFKTQELATAFCLKAANATIKTHKGEFRIVAEIAKARQDADSSTTADSGESRSGSKQSVGSQSSYEGAPNGHTQELTGLAEQAHRRLAAPRPTNLRFNQHERLGYADTVSCCQQQHQQQQQYQQQHHQQGGGYVHQAEFQQMNNWQRDTQKGWGQHPPAAFADHPSQTL
eukprot:CAMPEP_0115066756 /NCGR_PEP_ID=MMETSP0227-20121206/10992_1 /TAXON_ID=89957 /ORGANISM="Polarella glacialis, Strain CCMP 1383" /LENGTH=253 /DNA_ID=CAMNT_0002452709 /DNA_START=142 /DNA_END=903 /DNA_ORIENTATION=+